MKRKVFFGLTIVLTITALFMTLFTGCDPMEGSLESMYQEAVENSGGVMLRW